LLGGKAGTLWRLHGVSDVRVPHSMAVDARAFRHFVDTHFTGRQWSALVRDYRQGRRAPIFAELAHCPIPDEIMDAVMTHCPPGDLIIVRSSGLLEDGQSQSMAGHYESPICRRDVAGLSFAIKSCWLVGLRVYLDRPEAEGAPALAKAVQSSLALLIQGLVPARASGVYFSRSPVRPGRSMVVANWGTCHSVVDGSVATDTYSLKYSVLSEYDLRFKFEMTTFLRESARPGQSIQTPCGSTSVHVPLGHYLYRVRVPSPLDSQAVLDAGELNTIYRTGRRIAQALGYEVDVEWSFDGSDLVVLQARPITTRPPRRALPVDAEYGIASAGVATGPVRIVLSPDDVGRVQVGDIVAVATTDPDYMPILYRAAGILSEEGSPLSHTAIVARELKVPCLLGVPQATRGAFRDGEVVTIDGFRGRIGKAPAEAPPPVATSSTVLDVSHLPQHTGRPAMLALSALVAGYQSQAPGATVDAPRLETYRQSLQQRFAMPELCIENDVCDTACAAWGL
jgi:pyruvate,water dikinase